MSTRTALARNLAKLGAIRLLYWLHLVSSVLVPFFRDWGGLSYTEILLLNAWFMGWNFLLEVPTGSVADRFGRKVSLVSGCFVASVACLLYVSAPSIVVFLLAEVVMALALTLMSGADEALVYDSLLALGREGEASRWYARLESLKLLGIVLGALGGSVVAAWLGLRAPLLLQAIPAALAGVVALTLVEPVRHAPHGSVRLRTRLTAGLRRLRDEPRLRALTTDMVAPMSLVWLVIWLYQPLLETASVPLSAFGTVHAGMCLTQIAVLSGVGRLEAWLGSRRRYLLASALLPALAFLVMAASTSAGVVVPAILVVAGFGLTRPVVFAAELNRSIPSAERATTLSTVSMFRMLGIALVAPLAGWLADVSLALAFAAVGAASLVGAFAARTPGRYLEPGGPVPGGAAGTAEDAARERL